MKPVTLEEMMDEPPDRPAKHDVEQAEGEFVDRIEGDTAVLLKRGPGGVEERNVPLDSLPRGTKEGDSITPDGGLYGHQGASDADVINSLYAMPKQ